MRPFARFVALGDSLLSDDYPGPGLGAASLLLENKDRRFPDFRGKDLSTCCPGIQSALLCRTGWRVRDLFSRLELLQPSEQPVLAVLAIGGNDLLHWVAMGLEPFGELSLLEDRLRELISRLEELYSDLTLRVLNVYDPTDESGVVQSGRDVREGLPLLARLNGVLERLAGPRLIDIHGHFLGHGMRHRDAAYEHYDPEDPSGWIMFDIEPNPRGASEIRRLIWRSLP